MSGESPTVKTMEQGQAPGKKKQESVVNIEQAFRELTTVGNWWSSKGPAHGSSADVKMCLDIGCEAVTKESAESISGERRSKYSRMTGKGAASSAHKDGGCKEKPSGQSAAKRIGDQHANGTNTTARGKSLALNPPAAPPYPE